MANLKREESTRQESQDRNQKAGEKAGERQEKRNGDAGKATVSSAICRTSRFAFPRDSDRSKGICDTPPLPAYPVKCPEKHKVVVSRLFKTVILFV